MVVPTGAGGQPPGSPAPEHAARRGGSRCGAVGPTRRTDAASTSARDFITFADRRPEWRGTTLFIDGLDEVRAGVEDGRTPLDRIRAGLDALGRPRFRLSCREGSNVPVEIKKSGHRELWSAIRRQLSAKYARDPGAGGYGICVVFWLGNDPVPCQMPESGPRPESAGELEERLRGTLLPEDARLILVSVIDVVRPARQRSPQGSFPLAGPGRRRGLWRHSGRDPGLLRSGRSPEWRARPDRVSSWRLHPVGAPGLGGHGKRPSSRPARNAAPSRRRRAVRVQETISASPCSSAR